VSAVGHGSKADLELEIEELETELADTREILAWLAAHVKHHLEHADVGDWTVTLSRTSYDEIMREVS